MSTDYNWKDSRESVAISGVLTVFSATFIAAILARSVADVEICGRGVTFRQLSVLMFGIATALFVASAELFLYAKEFDTFAIPEPYRKLVQEDGQLRKKNGNEFGDEEREV